MRVAIYTRLSDDREGRSTGIDRQLEACRQYASAQGWTVAGEFSDSDLSAFKRGVVRPGYEEMLTRLDEVDAVLVWKLDRLVRRFLEFARLWEMFSKQGVAIVSATEPIDTSNAIGRIIVLMLVGFAELESETISLRQKAKHSELARQGRPSGGGRKPYPDEVILDAVERLLAGESVYAIARDHGMEPSHLRRALRSPRLVGRRRGQEVENGTIPALVSPETFDAVAAVLSARGGPSSSPSRRNLLTGLLICGACGSRLQVNRSRGRARYQCRGPAGCGKVSIEMGAVDDLVSEGVVSLVDRSELPAMDFDRMAVQAKIEADEQALVELTTARFVDRLISDEEYRAARGALAQRLTDSRARIDRRAIPQMQGKAREAWASADLSWRRSLLTSVLERVVVHPSKRGGQKGVFGSTVDLSRVEPVFRV